MKRLAATGLCIGLAWQLFASPPTKKQDTLSRGETAASSLLPELPLGVTMPEVQEPLATKINAVLVKRVAGVGLSLVAIDELPPDQQTNGPETATVTVVAASAGECAVQFIFANNPNIYPDATSVSFALAGKKEDLADPNKLDESGMAGAYGSDSSVEHTDLGTAGTVPFNPNDPQPTLNFMATNANAVCQKSP